MSWYNFVQSVSKVPHSSMQKKARSCTLLAFQNFIVAGEQGLRCGIHARSEREGEDTGEYLGETSVDIAPDIVSEAVQDAVQDVRRWNKGQPLCVFEESESCTDR